MTKTSEKRFTGWHATNWLVGFFGVVIAVNIGMARLAGSTFGGEVVENSYVASQHFNRWLDEAAKEKQLGWTAAVRRTAGDHVAVTLAGAPAGTVLAAEARHPLGRYPDTALHFSAQPDGSFLSREALPAGRWTLRLEANSDGKRWRSEEEFR